MGLIFIGGFGLLIWWVEGLKSSGFWLVLRAILGEFWLDSEIFSLVVDWRIEAEEMMTQAMVVAGWKNGA